MTTNENKKCACCGEFSLPKNSIFEICPVCNWQDDELQNENPAYKGGANQMSLNEAKEQFERLKN